MNRHIDYYEGNLQISSSFDFVSKLIDAWFHRDNTVTHGSALEIKDPKR